MPRLQLNWQQRLKRSLPDSVKFALCNFERVWIADGSTLEALFRKLKSLEDLKTGQLAGKICTVVDLVNRLPIEVWFHTNPAASETNFEAPLLNLLPAKTLILFDRGFYHFQFLQQLNLQDVHFITRLKAKASIKYLKIFSYDHLVKDRLIQQGDSSSWRTSSYFTFNRDKSWSKSIDVPGLGAKIKEVRETDSRSLKAIYEAVGMSQMNWYRIEEEKQSLPLETLRKIEEVLGVDFGVNLEGEGNV